MPREGIDQRVHTLRVRVVRNHQTAIARAADAADAAAAVPAAAVTAAPAAVVGALALAAHRLEELDRLLARRTATRRGWCHLKSCQVKWSHLKSSQVE
jgi:hypothetical protein